MQVKDPKLIASTRAVGKSVVADFRKAAAELRARAKANLIAANAVSEGMFKQAEEIEAMADALSKAMKKNFGD